MKIVYVSPEVAPFARTGGLGDVAGSLPKSLKKLGQDVSVFMPLYRHVRRGGFGITTTGLSVPVLINDKPVSAPIYNTSLPEAEVPVYFIENNHYYDRDELYVDPSNGQGYVDNCERFVFFSRAVLEAVRALDIRPDVIHVNDWQSAMISAYLKGPYSDDEHFKGTLTVLTIHNLAYQGVFPKEDFRLTGLEAGSCDWRGLEHHGQINFLKAGIVFSDIITTVSKKYAEEIQTEEFGAGLHEVLRERCGDLYGIINGIDYSVWNPEVDGLIPARYGPDNLGGKAICKSYLLEKVGLRDRNVPLIGMVGRLAVQKGIDLLIGGWEELMGLGVGLVLLGTGDKGYEEALKSLAARYPGRASVIIGFDNQLSHEIEAGADMFLMPSRYEPCGLNQLYSLKYGTVPVVRRTGGLADTIDPSVGFTFEEYSSAEMLKAVRAAVEAYRDRDRWMGLVRAGMLKDWSWDRSAGLYVKLYRDALKRRGR